VHTRADDSPHFDAPASVGAGLASLVELKNIYATAPVGLSCVDRDLRYISINDRMAAIHGLPASAHLGRKLSELIPELGEKVEANFRQVLETGAPIVDLECSGFTPADPGVEHAWIASYCPVTDSEGQIVGINVVVQDITERKAFERRLREASESLRQRDEFLHIVGDQLPKAMFFRVIHAPDGSFRFGYVSRGVEEIAGMTADHLLANPYALTDLIVEEDKPRFFEAMHRSLATLAPFDIIVRKRLPDASLHWCHFRSAVRALADGSSVCEGIELDITAHRHAEQALLESQAQNLAILSALPDLMFLMTTEGVYLDAHYRDAGDLLVPPEQFIGRSMFDILPPDLAQQFGRAMEQVMVDGSAVTDYSLTLNGERRHFEARMVQCGADKILSIVRDLTESKRAQTEAHHNRLELAHVSRVTMLAEITASLAHELNQPLTAIVANAQAAQHMAASSRPADPQVLRETLDDIVEAGQRAGDVIGRLRTWLNREEFLPQQLDVNQVIMNVEHLIRSELILRHVRMSFELESGLPDVSADRVQVQQVILNLAMNGIDAMQDRPGHDRHLAISTSAIGDEVQIAVRDRGTGIRAEHMDKLFDAFFSTKPNGLGIGLRICASIVSAHGGRIWAANNDDGCGATFCFTLPAVARFR